MFSLADNNFSDCEQQESSLPSKNKRQNEWRWVLEAAGIEVKVLRKFFDIPPRPH